jgi:hypothetical protein
MSVFYFPDYECVFIHNPKTGGSSIRNGMLNGKFEGPVHGHIPDEWQGYFKFCFVRNPFDRLISAWKMFTTGMQNTKWKFPEDANRELSLRAFLDIAMDESIAYSGHRLKLGEKIRHHTLPQSHPFNCVAHADHVGRFERIESDFSKICKRIGIAGAMPHWNKTERDDDYQQYYDETTRKMASKFYAEDLRLFEYSFDSPTFRKRVA